MFKVAQAIIKKVCSEHGVTPDLVKSHRRTRGLTRIRDEIARQLRAGTTLSWAEIGPLLGRTASYRGHKYPRKLST